MSICVSTSVMLLKVCVFGYSCRPKNVCSIQSVKVRTTVCGFVQTVTDLHSLFQPLYDNEKDILIGTQWLKILLCTFVFNDYETTEVGSVVIKSRFTYTAHNHKFTGWHWILKEKPHRIKSNAWRPTNVHENTNRWECSTSSEFHSWMRLALLKVWVQTDGYREWAETNIPIHSE